MSSQQEALIGFDLSCLHLRTFLSPQVERVNAAQNSQAAANSGSPPSVAPRALEIATELSFATPSVAPPTLRNPSRGGGAAEPASASTSGLGKV